MGDEIIGFVLVTGKCLRPRIGYSTTQLSTTTRWCSDCVPVRLTPLQDQVFPANSSGFNPEGTQVAASGGRISGNGSAASVVREDGGT